MAALKKKFKIGIPSSNSKLKVEFRKPTHEEFSIDDYGMVSARFLQYQRFLEGAGGPTFEEDMVVTVKANKAWAKMNLMIVEAMESSQVSNNNGGGKIDIAKAIGESDNDLLNALEEKGAFREWLDHVLPDDEAQGN